MIGGSPYRYFSVRDGGARYWKELDKMASLPHLVPDDRDYNKYESVIRGMSVAIHNGNIYAPGGWSRFARITNKFCVYSITTNQWRILPPMKVKRCHHCLVFHMNFVYAIGGGGGEQSMERYSLTENQWELFGDIETKITYACAVSYKQEIVVCSCERDNVSLTVQVYNPQKNIWHIVRAENLGGKVIPIAKPLLTIQDDTLYLMSFDGSSRYWRPKVRKLEINFECDGGSCLPCKCLNLVADGGVEPESCIMAFRINDKAFVSLGHAIYELVPQIDSKGRADYQLHKWQELVRYYERNSRLSNILWTFDTVQVSLLY